MLPLFFDIFNFLDSSRFLLTLHFTDFIFNATFKYFILILNSSLPHGWLLNSPLSYTCMTSVSTNLSFTVEYTNFEINYRHAILTASLSLANFDSLKKFLEQSGLLSYNP
ncbi:hypothetical protein PanWU01x14_030690 [Parasponia andersonii]|uniref:Uncharacterized protein n=1 Tax=Parasponia andersonii TaxID=3476 RepID=A0A2P5DUU1_PARAD|nr:hypothetical protein PanWU01x14_030690 [Parasponia andersonii]